MTTGTWEIALAGTALGLFGTWIMKVTDKCKCYCIKSAGSPCCDNCCGDTDFCTSYECGAGFTKKPLRSNGDGDTELKIAKLNDVDIAFVEKRGDFIHNAYDDDDD
jgi:hypothetical protein